MQMYQNLTLHPISGKLCFVSAGSTLRILEALAKDEITRPFHDTITCKHHLNYMKGKNPERRSLLGDKKVPYHLDGVSDALILH